MKIEKKYKIKNFIDLADISRKKYRNLFFQIKKIYKANGSNFEPFHWFVIKTDQIHYKLDYLNFLKINKSLKNINLWEVHINYSGEKDFNIKILGLILFIKFISNQNKNLKIIFSDLDLTIADDLLNILKRVPWNESSSFFSTKNPERSTGSFIALSFFNFLEYTNKLEQYIKSSQKFNYHDEILLREISKINLHKFFKLKTSKDNKNFSEFKYSIHLKENNASKK